MKPVIAVTTGDPFGVGPEVCLKAAVSPRVLEACRPLLVGDRAHLIRAAERIPGCAGADPRAWPEVARSGFDEWGTKQGDLTAVRAWGDGPALNDMGEIGAKPPVPAGPTPAGGRAAVQYVKQAVALVRSGAASAIVTAPLSKAAVRLAGHRTPGHTELLAEICGLERDEVVMMFVTPDLKVALLSTHLSLREAIDALDARTIGKTLGLLRQEHRRWFGGDPRLALCSLNPHAGEGGLFGREEEEILVPAVQAARVAGANVAGPFPADTLFVRAAKGEFDVVLALYHDQATIAVKARSFGSAVNMTLGLPFPRTSVDHGTAYDIAGRGLADERSLIEALLLAARLAGGPSRPPT